MRVIGRAALVVVSGWALLGNGCESVSSTGSNAGSNAGSSDGSVSAAMIGAADESFRRPGVQATGSVFAPLSLPAPSEVRLGSGAPGPDYWQQRADYRIDAKLDPDAGDGRGGVTASVRVRYTNNSPHDLDYMWLQFEQNLFRSDSIGSLQRTPGSVMKVLEAEFDGGYTVTEMRTARGEPLAFSVYDTLARVELPAPIESGGVFEFSFAFDFAIPPHLRRMGSEQVEQGNIYELAQWFPHVCNYDDVNGWNTLPYLGTGEFYTNFGSYRVNLTVPGDHIVSATGVLQNPQEVLARVQRDRLAEAMASDEPVVIIGPDEVGSESIRPAGIGDWATWRYHAEDVRTFAWASSDAFIWDAVGANITGVSGEERTVLCQSFYPREATAWAINDPGRGSTRAVKHAIEFYSDFIYPYPYPVMSNINGPEGGMEYPMIMFCGSRTDASGMFGVTDHEVGHTWFPMLVNSDERRYMWQDEGFNTFINIYSRAAWDSKAPDVQRHMRQVVEVIESAHPQPIVTPPDDYWPRFVGRLAYRKTGLGLYILREKILGADRFDVAFRDYVRRWAFKHPQPSDFFRSMEDAAGADLAWFWRGWFLEAADLDQAVVDVTNQGERAVITLENKARMVMPVFLRVSYDDGTEEDLTLPVEIWSATDRWGASIKTNGRRVTRVEVDPEGVLPDSSRRNNTWR